MLIGLHVSIAGNIALAPQRAKELGCETFQIFTRSPQGGKVVDLTPSLIQEFKKNCQNSGLKKFYVHTPYFINFASANNRIRYGSISVVRQELERADALGATALMTHLGSGKDYDQETAKQKVIEGLLKTLDGYVGKTQFLIELAAGSGKILGSSFEEIDFYIKKTEAANKKLKDKIGVCFDTCHAFAVGYDLTKPQAVNQTLKKFNQTIGLSRLKVIHANDSAADFNSHRDRHEHIGLGKIGLEGFAAIIKYPNLKNIDLIVETEHDGKEKDDLEILKKLRPKK